MFQLIIKFFALLLILNSTTTHAQKVGLVLSGGGARVLAHVGVIKALEEHDIPIDYITGTSAGAIVGSLYAMGFTPEEIAEFMLSEELERSARGIIDDSYAFYFNKPEPDAAWFRFRFNVDSIWDPALPTSLISPYVMDFITMRTLAGGNAVSGNNFDSLFIPFRCVAANIAQNTQVIFKDGDLPSAVRASMTYPLLFKPIIIDDMLLFDGGLYNNFPADVMQNEFAPDFSIGSNVSAVKPLPKQDDIMSHIINMVTTKTNFEMFCQDGVLINHENLPNVGITDFSKSAAIIDIGYQNTLKYVEEILQKTDRRISQEELNKRRKAFREKIPPLIFDDIQIDGLNKNQMFYVKSYLKLKKEPISVDDLEPMYYKLADNERISNIYPKAIFNEETQHYTLHLEVKEESRFSAAIGGLISSRPLNSGFFELAYHNLDRHPHNVKLNSYIGRFYSSLQLSSRFDLFYPWPIYFSPHFTVNQWDYFKSQTFFFEDIRPSYIIMNETNWGLDIGIAAGNKAKVVIDGRMGNSRDRYYHTNKFSRLDVPDISRISFNTLSIKYEKNSLNRLQYYNKGHFFESSIRYVSAIEENIPGTTSPDKDVYSKDHEWFQLYLKYENFFYSKNNLHIGFLSELFLSNRKLMNNYTSTLLSAPAFSPIPEAQTLFLPRFRAFNYVAGGMRVVYNFIDNFDLRLENYIFQPYERILKNDDYTARFSEPFDKRYYMSSVAVVYNSPFGPVSMSLNHYDRNEDEFSFLFNIGYIFFNRKGIR